MSLRTALIACAALWIGCTAREIDDAGDDAASDAGDGTTTGPTVSTATTTVGPTTLDPGTSVGSSTATTSTTTTTTTTVTATTDATADSTVSTTTAADAGTIGTTGVVSGPCEPAPDDTECFACTRQLCCEELGVCVDAEPSCACVVDCLASLEMPDVTEAMQCTTDCGADFLMIAVQLLEIQMCQQSMCMDVCGGA